MAIAFISLRMCELPRAGNCNSNRGRLVREAAGCNLLQLGEFIHPQVFDRTRGVCQLCNEKSREIIEADGAYTEKDIFGKHVNVGAIPLMGGGGVTLNIFSDRVVHLSYKGAYV